MKRGLKTLIGGGVLFILGAFVVPVAVVVPFIFSDNHSTQFVIPGTATYEVEEAGRYYLWNDFRTVHDGRSYNETESIPGGLRISIEGEDGRELPFASDTSISSSVGSSSKRSIGYVEVTGPETLSISVTGDADPRVFSFSKSQIAKMLGLIFGGVGASILMSLAGVGVAIWGIVKMVNDKKSAPPPPAIPS